MISNSDESRSITESPHMQIIDSTGCRMKRRKGRGDVKWVHVTTEGLQLNL
jgi:hypothetical protein